MNPNCYKSIGVFDSGLGGLTVLNHISTLLPYENIVYFGDTARMPYGTKSGEIIKKYAIENANFLVKKDIKALLIACNTASCFSFSALKEMFPIPIIEVTHPTAEAIQKEKAFKKIAILGTQATISSNVYQKLLPDIEVISIACPLLVHLVEEEYLSHSFVSLIIQEYLRPLKNIQLDALVLACTHFPLLQAQIQKELSSSVKIIDPGFYCAQALKAELEKKELLNIDKSDPIYSFYVSDGAEKFGQLGRKFLKNNCLNAYDFIHTTPIQI